MIRQFRVWWVTLTEETQYWVRWSGYGLVSFVAYYFVSKAAVLSALRAYWG